MRKDLATMAVNMEDYERIPPMRRVRDACVLQVYPDGRVALNGKLLEEVKRKNGSLELGFAWHKTDKRFVLLFPTEEPNYKFSPKGMCRDVELARALVEDGIMLTANYLMFWNAGANAWVGELDGERSDAALDRSIRAGTRRRKKQ